MKKIVALILSLVMIFALVACGSPAPAPSASASAAASPSASAAASASPSAAATAATGIAKDKIKVGFIHLTDPNDKGYTYNMDLGTKSMQKNLGLRDDQIVNKFNVSDQDNNAVNTAINELLDAKCNAIFATSFGFEDAMLAAAKVHPDVQFFHATGVQAAAAKLPNFHNYFVNIFEARYLSGIAAGMKLNQIGSTKLGFVGAYPYAEVISGFTSFYLGAKSVCPNATIDVIYMNEWDDPTKEAQIAQKLIDNGDKVIAQHTDSTAPATTAEKNKVFQIGYNADMISAAPNASITSACSDWGIYLTYAVQSVIDGKAIPADWSKGLAENDPFATGKNADFLSPLNDKIAAPGTKEAIMKAAADIVSGKLHVFAGPLTGSGVDFNNKPISIDLKAGEWFHESETTSAPSWNYIIPGVNIIS